MFMKPCLTLLVLLAAFAVHAQSTNAPLRMLPLTNSAPRQAGQPLAAQTAGKGTRAAVFTELKPNEIATGNVIMSGIGVEAVKQPNPLQLINPMAPPQYGSPDINMVRDPTSHRTGLKLFAIKF
jgi:hypothetical protein